MTASFMQGSGICGVSGIILRVQNLTAMAAWYGDVLGVPVEPDPETPFYEIDMKNGANLMLDDFRHMNEMRAFPICAFKTSDIERSRAWAKRNDVPVVLELQKPHEGLAYFHIRDPEGNVLRIVYSEWVNPNPVMPREANPPIENRISSLVVPVIELERAAQWYARFLGRSIKPDRLNRGPVCGFDMSGGTGVLLDDNRNNRDWPKLPTFMLKASDIRQAYRLMENKNADILRGIEQDRHFFAADPEGNPMIVCT